MLKYAIAYVVAGFVLDYFYSRCSPEKITTEERLYNVLFWPFRLFYKLLNFLAGFLPNNYKRTPPILSQE